MSEITIKEEFVDEDFNEEVPLSDDVDTRTVPNPNEPLPKNNCQTQLEEDETRLQTLLNQVSSVHAPEAVWIKEEPDSEEEEADGMVKVEPMERVQVKEEAETDDGGCESSTPIDIFEPSNAESSGAEHDDSGGSQLQDVCQPEGNKPVEAAQTTDDNIYHDVFGLLSKEDSAPGTKRFPCTVCWKVFGKKQVLKMHSMIHTGERPFPCTVCGRKFRKRAQLNIHSVTHTGNGAFSCNQCDRSFGQKNDLSRHMLTHTGERPFSCSLCSKTFSRRGHYDEHLRIHSGVRLFHCDQCKKSFTHHTSLRAHLRLHRGEQPYECDQCGKRFTQKGALMTHMPLHTGERRFACDKCGRTFVTNSNYKKHVCSRTRPKREISACGTDGKVLEESIK